MSEVAKNRREFLIKSASTVAVATAGSATLVACGGGESARAEFKYGVASGDPLADRVIIWTHAKLPDSNESVFLNWQVSTSPTFDSLVNSGSIVSSQDSGFTNKVDVTGLSAGTNYYYRFIHYHYFYYYCNQNFLLL